MSEEVKILSIDDSKLVRMQVRKAFEAYNVDFYEAENGKEGLKVAREIKPDVVILDITMPVMSGEEMLPLLRADRDIGTTPVLMLSAELSKAVMVRMAKLGSNDYIPKPFKKELLAEKVAPFLKGRLAKREVQAKPQSTGQTSSQKQDETNVSEWFTAEHEHLHVVFPSFDVDIFHQINRHFPLKLVEALNNRIEDIFLDLSAIEEGGLALAACLCRIAEECDLHRARCHILVRESVEDELNTYPGCDDLNFYRPPEEEEGKSS